jgi:hypothetical protein
MQIEDHDRYDYSPIFERPQFDWPNGKRPEPGGISGCLAPPIGAT